MACARGAKKEDGTSHLGNPRPGEGRDRQGSEDEVSRSILVSNIPEGVSRDKLEIHFMRASNGGSEIESITMVTDTEAKITYLDGAAVERVLEKPQVLNGVEVKVQKWAPPEDDTKRVPATTEQDSRSILVSNIPAGVNRDKLEIHFMRTCNGGSEIESITMVTDTEAKITYLDGAAVERVLARPHALNGVEVRVHKWTPPEDKTKVGATATSVENSRSILVSNIPEGVSRDKLKEHFMEVSNGGGEIESVNMVTETVAIITYLDSAAVTAVLGIQHALNGIPFNVQEWHPDEVFDEVHATVEHDIACHIPQSEMNKVKDKTGIKWEKIDDVIEVKGAFKQVEDAQKLLQEWIKERMAATNGPVFAADKDSEEANKIGSSPDNNPKRNTAMNGSIRVTGLEDEKPSNSDMDDQKTQEKASDQSHLNPEAAAQDEEITRKGWQSNGGQALEEALERMSLSSNQDGTDGSQGGTEMEKEDKGTPSKQENPTHSQEHAAEGGHDGGHPQQTGKQKEDAAKSSPAYEGASSTLDDKQKEERLDMVYGTSNEETGSIASGTRHEAESIKGSTTSEEREKLETEVSDADNVRLLPQPLSADESNVSRVKVLPSPYLNAFHNGQSVNILLDSGAKSSMIREDEVKRLGLKIVPNSTQTPSDADGGRPSGVLGECRAHFYSLHKLPLQFGALVVTDLAFPIIAGSPFLKTNGITIDFKQKQVQLQDGSTKEYVPPPPLSNDDKPSDEDEQRAKASSDSGPSKDPKAGNSDGHLAGDQDSTKGLQTEAADSAHGDDHGSSPTHVDVQKSPNDLTTPGSSPADESPEAPNRQVTQPRRAEKRKATSHPEPLEKDSVSPKHFAYGSPEAQSNAIGKQLGEADKTKKAFYTEKLVQEKKNVPPDQLSSVVTVTTGNPPSGKDHKADSAFNAGSTGSNQEDNSPFEVFVEPDVLTYIRHKHHSEITGIGKKYESVFHTSADNTKAYFVSSPSKGRIPEPEKAIDEFITLYQQVFSKIKCENFDVVQYKLAPTFLLDGLRKVRQNHPEVLTKAADDDTLVRFMGEPEKIRAARADLCGLLAIPVSRASRRRGNSPPTSTDSAGGGIDVLKGAGGAEKSPVILFKHTFEQGVELKVAHGNITTLKVDAIVNAADARLKHGGGVAKAIVEVGGDIIQEESTEKIKTRGFLRPTETEITGAGRLPCKHIIHAHGPQWQASQARQCSDMLTETCINILQAAEGLKAESVAIPAISSGKYGMPKEVCANALLSGVLEYLSTKHAPSCSLREIWFIDMTGETIEALVDVFATEIAGLQSPSRHGKAKSQPTVKQNRGANPSQVSNPPQNKTYASAAATGVSKATGGHVHRNDSSQVAALIALWKGPGIAQQVTQDRSSQQGKGGATGGGNDGTTRMATRSKKSGQPNTGKDKNDEDCPICLSAPTNPMSLPCKAQGCKGMFCKKCLDKAMETKSRCPVCSAVVGKLMGNQPEGRMKVSFNSQIKLSGCKSTGVIVIDYIFKDGIQGLEHPNPGNPYKGTTRTAYLPRNTEGEKVLGLLRQAFNQKLTFTIGTSSTTGKSDTVTWNDIHHKTNTFGGPIKHGYPDPGYLQRVTEELAAKGIK